MPCLPPVFSVPAVRPARLAMPLSLRSALACFVFVLGLLAAASLSAAQRKAPAGPARAAWVEPDFPFFSSTLDARKAQGVALPDNLAPRALVLNLGRGFWAAFDPDLLRVVAVWRGAGVTPKALAPGSYHDVSRKTPDGQSHLPTPDGELWLATGTYPGWQTGETVSLADPREPGPSPEEVGRGALDERIGRFGAVRFVGRAVVLDYTVAGAAVSEWFTLDEAGAVGGPVVGRNFEVAPSTLPLRLVVGTAAPGVSLSLRPGSDRARSAELAQENGVWTVRVPARAAPLAFGLVLARDGVKPAASLATPRPTAATVARWPQEVVTAVTVSPATDAYVVDHFALPEPNPWRRGVRTADVQFRADGTGVVVTLDGDVWLAHGLAAARRTGDTVRWRRFASGLHEPMNVALRDGEIFVFDKNGVWRLPDADNNGEADAHVLFSNAFAQTADLREFPSSLRLGPGGEFVIAKGGQQAQTQGKHNGSVLRLSADGRHATVLGYGFRQPNIAVHPRTGLVTSSDQQGHYIPSTPLHIVRDRRFYGFLPPFAPKEEYPAPPAEPLTWLPHAVNGSAASQVWLEGSRLGPLDGGLVHIGYNKPELFRVLFNDRGPRPQASVVNVTRAFRFPPLHGSVNPADGQLYVAGFQIVGWGNVLDVAAGLGRVRYTGAPVTLPREIVPTDRGVLLRFEVALDPAKARDPASYSLQSWGYKRTHKYGSPQYKADGTPGQDYLTPSAAYLSADGRAVFVAVPDMTPVMQLRVGWSLATAAGAAFEENAYTTPYALVPFDPAAEGFGNIEIDLTPRAAVAAKESGPVSADEGRRLAQLFACVACHAEEPNRIAARSGPPWRGLYGRTDRPVFIGGKAAQVNVDDAFIREAILDPTAKVAAGFEEGEYAMPSYAGVLSDSQIESLVLYLKALK